MCGELSYAATYVHSFCMLYCVERQVDMPLHTIQHAKRINLCCRITTLEDSNFNQDLKAPWWSKHVGVILSVLMCDIWINVVLKTSALVGPLYIIIHTVCLRPLWPKCDHAYSKRVISGLAAGPTRSFALKEIQRSEGSVSAFVILGNRQMNNYPNC
jgi:hypothetical protein